MAFVHSNRLGLMILDFLTARTFQFGFGIHLALGILFALDTQFGILGIHFVQIVMLALDPQIGLGSQGKVDA